MPKETQDLAGRPADHSPANRLDSWKEVAAYLKCSERTVRRWQEEGLPVYRHPHKKKAAIYAYKAEIDAWWRNGHEQLRQIEGRKGSQVDGSFFLKKPWLLAGGLALTAIVVLTLTRNASLWRDRSLAASSGPSIQSLAVLPLQNLSRDPDQEYFADGMTDALITDLAHIGSLKVISRTSSMQYKQTKKSLAEIARELNVDGIVEGTVQRSGDRVRITAQLIQGPQDRHLWAETYEGDLRDLLALQDQVANAIANQVRITLTPQEQTPLTRAEPVNLEAHELYLKGRYYWNKRTPKALRTSLEYFQSAVEKDPNYALGYAGLADSYAMLGSVYGLVLPAKEAYPKAEAAAKKALQLDNTLAEAHTTLAWCRFRYDWDWPGAEREFKRAIELNPGYADAHHFYFHYLSTMGRFSEAVAEARKAESLDPVSLATVVDVGTDAFRAAGRYDEEMQQCRKALDMDPNFAPAHACLGDSYEHKGMHQEAIAEFRKGMRLSGSSSPWWLSSLGILYARAGRHDDAIAVINKLKSLSRREFVPPEVFVGVYAELGDKDQTFAYLQKAYEDRSMILTGLKADTSFDPLRSDPRFQDLVRRMNFPP